MDFEWSEASASEIGKATGGARTETMFGPDLDSKRQLKSKLSHAFDLVNFTFYQRPDPLMAGIARACKSQLIADAWNLIDVLPWLQEASLDEKWIREQTAESIANQIVEAIDLLDSRGEIRRDKPRRVESFENIMIGSVLQNSSGNRRTVVAKEPKGDGDFVVFLAGSDGVITTREPSQWILTYQASRLPTDQSQPHLSLN